LFEDKGDRELMQGKRIEFWR